MYLSDTKDAPQLMQTPQHITSVTDQYLQDQHHQQLDYCTFDLPTGTTRIGEVVLVLAIETTGTGAGVASLKPVLYIMNKD